MSYTFNYLATEASATEPVKVRYYELKDSRMHAREAVEEALAGRVRSVSAVSTPNLRSRAADRFSASWRLLGSTAV